MSKKIRVNFNMDSELKEWAEEQADAYGITLTGMLNIAVAQYKQQCEGLKAMSNVEQFVEKLRQELAKKDK